MITPSRAVESFSTDAWVDADTSDDWVTIVEQRRREGARYVTVCVDGGSLCDPAIVRRLGKISGVRVRIWVDTFDPALHARYGGRSHPRDILRGIARASESGLGIEVVLPLAQELAPAAGRLHGLARIAPHVRRYLISTQSVASALTPLAPEAQIAQIADARTAAIELGVNVEIDPDPDRRADRALARQAVEHIANGDLLTGLQLYRRVEHAPNAAFARPLFDRVRGLGPREKQVDVAPPASPRSDAWARAWAGDLEGVRVAAESREERDRDALLGVVYVLERKPKQALPLLDAAIAHRAPADVSLHRVHALLQLDQLEAARRALADLTDGESFGCRVLHALVSLRGAYPWTIRRWATRARTSHTLFNGLFATELPALLGHETLDRACSSRQSLRAMLEDLLTRMAGNLGTSPTFATVAPDGTRQFSYIDLPKTSRMAAIDALFSIRDVGVEGAEKALDDVLAIYPGSVLAHTYRGELYLWVGRYEEAAKSFFRAAAIEPTRWAEIGLIGVAALTGRPLAGRAMTWVAEHHFPPVAGGTLPVYRGSLRRRMGDPRAIDDLRTAVTTKPTRVGPRIELILALREAGRDSEAEAHLEPLITEAMGLLFDAAEAAGADTNGPRETLTRTDVLEEALLSMRGNRSSSIVTWFDRHDTLHVLESKDSLSKRAKQLLRSL